MRLTLMPIAILLGLGLCVATAAPGCTKSSTPATKTAGKPGPAGTETPKAGTSDAEDQSPIPFVEVTPKACMLHAEAEGYFRCLAGTGGECFHFGASCAPPALCMFEKNSKLHKTCTEEHQGQCERYGSTCTPKDSCMFDSASHRYRQCKAAKAGACSSFGEACLPAA